MQLGGSSAAAPAARPAAGAAVDGLSSGDGETSTDTTSGSGGLVGVAGEASSAPPPRLSAVSSAAASAPAAAPEPSRSTADGIYGTQKGASATPGTVAGPIVQGAGANPTDDGTLNGTASEQHTFGETSVQSDGGRGLLLAGSLVLLWAGIALLVVRQLVRRSIQH